MKNQNYIGINQRIPLNVLEQSLIQFLNTGALDKAFVIEQLSIFFKGKNRIVKAYGIVKKLFMDNKALIKLRQHLKPEDFKKLDRGEKNALILAIMIQAYPFAFNLVNNLASVLKVQETCNTKLIYSKMSSYYGSNRATEIAIYSIVPLLIEMNLIKRVKPGLYSINQTYRLKNETISQYFLLSYLSGTKTKSILSEDIYSHPWFFFFKPEEINFESSTVKLLKSSGNRLHNYLFAIN